jgi:hypothetical protein
VFTSFLLFAIFLSAFVFFPFTFLFCLLFLTARHIRDRPVFSPIACGIFIFFIFRLWILWVPYALYLLIFINKNLVFTWRYRQKLYLYGGRRKKMKKISNSGFCKKIFFNLSYLHFFLVVKRTSQMTQKFTNFTKIHKTYCFSITRGATNMCLLHFLLVWCFPHSEKMQILHQGIAW